MAKTPKVQSTRLSLPLGVAGSEPTEAPIGSLAYATDTESVRVRAAAGWTDVGGSGTPTGPAGGDLAGTYPNPTVTQARGLKSATTTVAVSAATAPTSGQVLTATGGTAATWQTPSSTPTGSAGGDLAGTYPNPTVTQAAGLKSATTTVAVSAATAPTSGQVLTATGGTAATWQTPSSAPTGSAGGDLAGTYPNPTVTQARGLKSATTTVSVSAATAPTSGQVLTATSGTAATWQSPSAGGVTTVAAGTGISVATPTGPTATVSTNFGATSTTSCVGNDSRLSDDRTASGLRTASTVVVVSGATAPTAGQGLIASSSTAAAWVTLGNTYSLRDEIWDPPTVGTADDDEFTVDGLASGTWVMYAEASPFTTPLTRDGGLDLTAAPATGHYRSSAIGSTLYVQIQNNSTAAYVMVKPLAGALSSKQWWMLGIGMPGEAGSAGVSNPVSGVYLYKKTGSVPDNQNRAGFRTQTSSDLLNLFGVTANAATGNINTNTLANPGLSIDGLVMEVNHGASTANLSGFAFKRGGALVTIGSSGAATTGPQFNSATDYMAIYMKSVMTNTPNIGVATTLYALHFIRRIPVTAGGWIAQS